MDTAKVVGVWAFMEVLEPVAPLDDLACLAALAVSPLAHAQSDALARKTVAQLPTGTCLQLPGHDAILVGWLLKFWGLVQAWQERNERPFAGVAWVE